jgi:O-palmitoleoyl-L-serine hydrolase
MVVGGMLSPNSTINPYLHNYSLVFLHYCDGASGASAAVDPVQVPAEVRAEVDSDNSTARFRTRAAPSEIWFRGRANLLAQLAYLQQSGGMSAPVNVILTGGSAGASAAYYAADVVRSLLPRTVSLVVAPDAGFFQDYNASSSGQNYRESFQAADAVWNASASGSLNAGCLEVNPGPEAWRCFFQAYAAPHITVPLFVMNSAYDAWQVGNDLGLGCVPCAANGGVCQGTNCSAAQMATFQAYRDLQLSSMSATLAVPGNGAWVASWCVLCLVRSCKHLMQLSKCPHFLRHISVASCTR